ncbi:linker for activation of T-cells family member 1 [Echinops telfairi]|uniref:Linker for activation of T-cells family member 1 n=1 Tax=Echinops telfairi TaxID=9371 RepID=A0AC55CKV0_ECHTE|nr:linker for activation of T-cells family member 1 [Echinops telfairi]
METSLLATPHLPGGSFPSMSHCRGGGGWGGAVCEPDDFLPSPSAHHSFLPQAGADKAWRSEVQMEAVVVASAGLGLLLPFLAVLLLALCLRCRELPASYDSASSDGLYPGNLQIKRPYTIAHWPPDPIHTTSYPMTQPDVPPIPTSPRPPVSCHQMLSSRQDSESAISVASYENEEPACEDTDEDEEEDEEDYPNSEGYLEVLPDSAPPTAEAPRSLRESACSSEWVPLTNTPSPAPRPLRPAARISRPSSSSGSSGVVLADPIIFPFLPSSPRWPSHCPWGGQGDGGDSFLLPLHPPRLVSGWRWSAHTGTALFLPVFHFRPSIRPIPVCHLGFPPRRSAVSFKERLPS